MKKKLNTLHNRYALNIFYVMTHTLDAIRVRQMNYYFNSINLELKSGRPSESRCAYDIIVIKYNKIDII